MTEGETQILYSLYGIVEHSGTMRSGHYTGYVKVRPEGPKSTSNGHALDGRHDNRQTDKQFACNILHISSLTRCFTAGDAEPGKGSWFHVSDTSVQPVSESKVQSCQAYLLFYERILWSNRASLLRKSKQANPAAAAAAAPVSTVDQ